MSENEMFKTTLMGGYDKEDVMEQLRKMKDAHAGETARLVREIQQKNNRIEELTQRLTIREEQNAKLERDIETKYQQYIDHYDSISRFVVEAQIRSENIIKEAKMKGEKIIAQAEKMAQQRINSVQAEVDERLAEGKRKYVAVQEELNELVGVITQVQNRIMSSYEEVHQIVKSMPESLQDFEEPVVQEENKVPTEESIIQMAEKSLREIERKVRKDLELEDVLDEEDDLTEEDIERFLQKHGITK